MQKNFFLIAALSLVAMQACKKYSTPPHEELIPAEAQVKADRAVFKSEKDYSMFWTQPDEQQKAFLTSLQTNVDFTSLLESRKQANNRTSAANNNTTQKNEGCSIPEDVLEANSDFFSLLNKDGVIEIGANVFCIDYCNNQAYVTSSAAAKNAATYKDFLAGKTTNPAVLSFSLDADVLEAVEKGVRAADAQEGIPTTPASSLQTAAVSGADLFEWKYFKDMEDAESHTGNTRMDGKLAYDKFGIYFNLYGKEKYQRNSLLVEWITVTTGTRQWRVEYTYRYDPRGSGERSGSGTLYPAPAGSENKTETTIYDGSRGLDKYDIRWDVWTYTDNYKITRQLYGSFAQDFGEFLDSQPSDIANYFWNINVQYPPPVYYQYSDGY